LEVPVVLEGRTLKPNPTLVSAVAVFVLPPPPKKMLCAEAGREANSRANVIVPHRREEASGFLRADFKRDSFGSSGWSEMYFPETYAWVDRIGVIQYFDIFTYSFVAATWSI